MRKDCLVEHTRHCDIWFEYQLALVALEEADDLCHNNWMEMDRLYKRIHQLEQYLQHLGIDMPEPETQPYDYCCRLSR